MAVGKLRTQMNKEQKLELFARVELERNVYKMIVEDEEGGYIVFGRYYIRSVNGLWEVYELDQFIHQFHNKRTAMAWCTSDKFKLYQRASEILALDRKKQNLMADISCRRTLGDRSRQYSFYEIVNMKIEPKIATLELVSRELEKCITSAKYLQIRGFNNETV